METAWKISKVGFVVVYSLLNPSVIAQKITEVRVSLIISLQSPILFTANPDTSLMYLPFIPYQSDLYVFLCV